MDELSPAYVAAIAAHDKAIAAYRKIAGAYRKREIGDVEFERGRRTFDDANDAFDKAFDEEKARGLAKIVAGDRVKSFDFEGRRDCYIEGTVVAVGMFKEFGLDCERYRIQIDKRIVGGKELEDTSVRGEEVFPPVNGTPRIFGGLTNGVERA